MGRMSGPIVLLGVEPFSQHCALGSVLGSCSFGDTLIFVSFCFGVVGGTLRLIEE